MATKQYPNDDPKARQKARRRRRRRRLILAWTILLTIILLLVLVVALIVLRITGAAAKKNGTPSSFLGVKNIEVVGESRYTSEEIIKASGIYVGESLLVINKVQAHNAILRQFPYLDFVEVGNASFSNVRIKVRETAVMGAVQTPQGWMMAGVNNHALELLEETALPEGTLRITGAALAGEQVGGALMDERSLRISRVLTEAAASYGLSDLTRIDMTEKTNLRIIWRDQIVVTLGNESHLSEQVKALVDLLPTLLNNNGETATGRLDMSSYADDNGDNDKAVFTPTDGLPQDTQTSSSSNTTTGSPDTVGTGASASAAA